MLFNYLLLLLDDLRIHWCGITSPWCFQLLHFCSTRNFFFLQKDPPGISSLTTNQLNGLPRFAKFYRLKSSSCPLLQAVEKSFVKCDRVGNNPFGSQARLHEKLRGGKSSWEWGELRKGTWVWSVWVYGQECWKNWRDLEITKKDFRKYFRYLKYSSLLFETIETWKCFLLCGAREKLQNTGDEAAIPVSSRELLQSGRFPLSEGEPGPEPQRLGHRECLQPEMVDFLFLGSFLIAYKSKAKLVIRGSQHSF